MTPTQRDGRDSIKCWQGPVCHLIISQHDKSLIDLEQRCVAALQGYRLSEQSARKNVTDQLRDAFLSKQAIVAIGSAAILIRTLGPLCKSKHSDSPVICVDVAGTAVMVLLGAKNGGSEIARDVGNAIGAIVCGEGPATKAFFDKSPEPKGKPQHTHDITGQTHGWRWHPEMQAPRLHQSIEKNALSINLQLPVKNHHLPFFLPTTTTQEGNSGKHSFSSPPFLRITATINRAQAEPAGYVLHPPLLTLGLGFIRNADPKACLAWIRTTLQNQGLAEDAIGAIGSITEKADEPALHVVAKHFNRPLRVFPASDLKTMTGSIANPSPYVEKTLGTPSVAEAAALILAGPSSSLIVQKQKTSQATLALALASDVLLPAKLPGHRLGTFAVVGIGPGDSRYMTNAALQQIGSCDALFGYNTYVARVSRLFPDLACHSYPIGAEKERVKACLEFAAKGKNAVLVCSGDPAIYGLASLSFEVRHDHTDPLVRGVTITVEPGISAMQLASARVGGILNHDFCAISLSDLMTPQDVILQRVEACAKADMVIAFYNPQSEKRRLLLPQALARLQHYRGASCPVILAHYLAQDQEQVDVYTLSTLPVEMVTMNTVVLIGNQQTRQLTTIEGSRLATPRGYLNTKA